MDLKEPISPELEELLHRAGTNGDEAKLCVATDIASDGNFGRRWLVATPERVLVLSLDEDDKPLEVPLREIKSAKTESLVGVGALEVTANGRTIELLRYSNTLSGKFGQVAKSLEGLAKTGVLPALPEEEDRLRCKECGRVIAEWIGTCPYCMKRGRLLRRLLGYAKPYWPKLVLAAIMTLSGTALELAPPQLMRILVDDVLKEPFNAPLLVWLVIALAGIRITGTLLTIGRGYLMAWLGAKVSYDIRARLYHALQRLRLRFYDRQQTGQLMSRVTGDTERIWELIAQGSQDFAISVLFLLGIGVILAWMNWQLALFMLVPMPIMVLATGYFMRKLHGAFHQLWHRFAAVSALIGDVISGIRVVKAFAQEEREVNRFDYKSIGLLNAGVRATRAWATFFPAITLMTSVGGLIVWYFGGLKVIEEVMTLGTLMAFIMYLGMFYRPIMDLTRVNHWLQRGMTSAERVFEVMDGEPEVYETPDAVAMPKIRGEVEFQNVTFGYDKQNPVLHNIDLKVDEGEMVGLVGHSGAGKTTMINLLCRFYDVDEGKISIDGVDIGKIRLKDLRSQIGIVPQEPFLFHGSIAENISYGKPGASQEEIIRAAKAANAHEFIMRQPDGYDTQVGERGTRVSAGERQRISIARAILHDPSILILDEATASVDTETERQIQEALARLIKNRTTFAIAHRLSTLRNANRLLVLEDGKRVELGTHEELLAKEGVYHKLVQLQSELSKIKAVDG